MTGFAGVVHLDGGQPDAGALDDLLRLIGHWGQGSRRQSSAGACFGQVGAGQHLPTTSVKSGVLITATARLDNRNELVSSLCGGNHDECTLSDEHLLVNAFECWGEACPHHVNGDWTLAAWSPGNKRLFLARDHFGNTALYYARVGERVAFASDVNALLSLRWVPRRLNETRMASLLVGGGVDDPASTVYDGISCIPPAHTVVIEPRHQETTRYWRVEDTRDSGPQSPLERAELLRASLRAAVRSRLRTASRVGSMLSGGLDSGAVTAFAAEHLQRHGRRLTAFTSVPAFATPSGRRGRTPIDEGAGAADVVRSFDCIDHVLVPARTATPVASIRRVLAIVGAPSVAAPNLVWITAIMGDAQARGMDVLLTGQVGDFVMAGRPSTPSWRRDWSARRYRRLLRRVTPNWLLRLRAAEWKPWGLTGAPWRDFSVINAEFASEIRLVERLRDVGRDPRNLKPAWEGPSAVARQAMSDVGATWAPLGASYGLTVLDPLQDKQVMELMFSSPQPPEAWMTPRWLFRQSLVGVLPEPVRVSRSKGVQSADIADRLVASWSEVGEALAVAEGSPLARRCLDLPYCRALAESLRSPLPPARAMRNAVMLVNGISAALFLAERLERGGPG